MSLFIEHIRVKDKTASNLLWLAERARVETCAVVAAEVFYGARKKASIEEARTLFGMFRIHDFRAKTAARLLVVVPDLVRINCVADLSDLMIGVTALELDLPVATLNRSHFEHVPGLEVVQLPFLGPQSG